MVAGTDILIDAETWLHRSHSALERGGDKRPLPALAVQHTFRRRNDDLGAGRRGAQRLFQGRRYLGDIIGPVNLTDPRHADPLQRLSDRVFGRFGIVGRPRRQQILAPGRGGIVIVDDNDDAVILVIDGVANRRGQAVMPEAAIADERDRSTLGGGGVERRCRCRPQTVSHGRRPKLEGRHDREQVTADIRGDVMRAQFLLNQFHRHEDRPFRASGAKAGRPHWHRLGKFRAD